MLCNEIYDSFNTINEDVKDYFEHIVDRYFVRLL
jgi:hypothetical protein